MWTLITLYTQFCMNETDLTSVIQDFKFPFFNEPNVVAFYLMEIVGISLTILMAYLVALTVKSLTTKQETWVRSLGWEDPLEEGMATYSCILAWRIPMDREAWRAPVHGDHKESDTNEQRSTHINTYMYVYVYYWLSLWFRQ